MFDLTDDLDENESFCIEMELPSQIRPCLYNLKAYIILNLRDPQIWFTAFLTLG